MAKDEPETEAEESATEETKDDLPSTEELLGDTLFTTAAAGDSAISIPAADSAGDGPGPAQGQAAQMSLIAQYTKDLSFENPNAPQTFSEKEAPKIDVAVDVVARQVSAEQYEADLKFSVRAAYGERTGFVAELVYSGLFGIRGVPPEQIQAVCLIECPRLLFPFARRILADATRDGGYPPLLLDPIDFMALYQQRVQQEQAEDGKAGSNGSGKVEAKG